VDTAHGHRPPCAFIGNQGQWGGVTRPRHNGAGSLSTERVQSAAATVELSTSRTTRPGGVGGNAGDGGPAGLGIGFGGLAQSI
jgi:hypothetical protein